MVCFLVREFDVRYRDKGKKARALPLDPGAIAFENRQRPLQLTSANKEQLTKVFASFFKKKHFFLFFFEKKNQKTFVNLAFFRVEASGSFRG
ncbi:MAG: hypothetical protein WDN04_25530 [Rhodospirillales bacterium]